MKKILVGLLACAMIFTMSIPSAFAAKDYIAFWQNGGNVTTIICIVANDGSVAGGAYTSTGASISITLTAESTGAGYTVSPTSGDPQGTTGQTFATAQFLAGNAGSSMIIDTAQIGGSTSTNVWTTSDAYSATAARFGHGVVDTGTATTGEFRGWVAVYGGSQPQGFTVDLGTI